MKRQVPQLCWEITFFQVMIVTALLTGNSTANSLTTHMHKSKLQQHLTGEIMSFPNTGEFSIPVWAAVGWWWRADSGREGIQLCQPCCADQEAPTGTLLLCTAGCWSQKWSLSFSHILCLCTFSCVLTLLCLFLTRGSLLSVSLHLKTFVWVSVWNSRCDGPASLSASIVSGQIL